MKTGICKDASDECGQWKVDGSCRYVSTNCLKSCNVCGARKHCIENDDIEDFGNCVHAHWTENISTDRNIKHGDSNRKENLLN